MELIIVSLIVLGLIGISAGILLAVSSRVFAVKTDPKIESIEKMLPGSNCGGCGNPSCFVYAQNIVEKGFEPNLCVLAADKVEEIGRLIGKSVVLMEKKTAVISCGGGMTAKREFLYDGITSCFALSRLNGGDVLCKYSCLGFGDCVNVCPFGAISMIENRCIDIQIEKCTGCGKCVNECPRQVISLIPADAKPVIACRTKDPGKTVRQICDTGCISCKICIKSCPEKAIFIKDDVVTIDYKLCTSCGICIEKCPRKTIKVLRRKVFYENNNSVLLENREHGKSCQCN